MARSLAIFANPMAGRDVRRLAARASTVTHEYKMDAIARVAVGADAVGVSQIHSVHDPFRLATQALTWIDLKAKVFIHDNPVNHDERDTLSAISTFVSQGVNTVVALGGDGTHRVISKAFPDLNLIPLSTGTNNAFPLVVEPTLAGMAAGFSAGRHLSVKRTRIRAKVLHIEFEDGSSDIALIDVVVLKNDFVGNNRQYKAENLAWLVLTTALPDAIGMSPIGGMLNVVTPEQHKGLAIRFAHDGDSIEQRLRVPISPGYFEEVTIAESQVVALEQTTTIQGPGIVGVDGDRIRRLEEGELANVTIRRDGPYVVDPKRVLRSLSRMLPTAREHGIVNPLYLKSSKRSTSSRDETT